MATIKIQNEETYTVNGSVRMRFSYTPGYCIRGKYAKINGVVELVTQKFNIHARISSIDHNTIGGAAVLYWKDTLNPPAYVWADGTGTPCQDFGTLTFNFSANVTDKINYPFNEYLKNNGTITNRQTRNSLTNTYTCNIGTRDYNNGVQPVYVKDGMNLGTTNFNIECYAEKEGSSVITILEDDPLLEFSPCHWKIEVLDVENPTSYSGEATGLDYTIHTAEKSYYIDRQYYTIPEFNWTDTNVRTVKMTGETIECTGICGQSTTYTRVFTVQLYNIINSSNTLYLGSFVIESNGVYLPLQGLSGNKYLNFGTVTPSFSQNTTIFNNPTYVNCEIDEDGYISATGNNPHIVYKLSNNNPFRFPMGRYFSCYGSYENGGTYYPRIYLTSKYQTNTEQIVNGSYKTRVFEIRVNKKNGYFDTLDSHRYSSNVATTKSLKATDDYYDEPYHRQPVSMSSTYPEYQYFGLSASDSTIYQIIVTVPKVGKITVPTFNFRLIGDGFWCIPAEMPSKSANSTSKNYYRHTTYVEDGCPIIDLYRLAPTTGNEMNVYSGDYIDFLTIGDHNDTLNAKLSGSVVNLNTNNLKCSIVYNGTTTAYIDFENDDGDTFPVASIGKDFTVGIDFGNEDNMNLLRLCNAIPGLFDYFGEPYTPFGEDCYKYVLSSEPLGGSSEEIEDTGYYITYRYDRYGNFDGDNADNYVTLIASAEYQPIFKKNRAICKLNNAICHGLGHNSNK